MNLFGKVLLALSSLGPFFFTCSFNCMRRGDYYWAGGLLLVFLGCAAISWLLPMLCKMKGEKLPLATKKVKPADKEMFAFLLLYLLPLLTKENSISFAGEPLTSFVILFVIILAVCHSNSFTFNPMLGLLSGYHFYEVDDDKGMSLLLLTKKVLIRPDNELTVVHLIDYVYLDSE
jgi:hypothetical protein